jgi:hypothetical protein
VRLEALVLPASPNTDNLLVQTALGNVELRTPLPIPPDTRLVLQVATTTPVLQLLILSIDGEPPALFRPGGPTAPGAAPSSGRVPAPSASVPIADRIHVGTVIEATLLRAVSPAPTRATATPEKPAVPAGSPDSASFPRTLLARATQIGTALTEKLATFPNKFAALLSPPTGAGTRGESPLVDTPTIKGVGVIPGRANAPDTIMPKVGLPPGTIVTARVTALRADAPAPAPAAQPVSLGAGTSLVATVLSSTPGHTIAATDAGPVILATAEALPKNLRLSLELIGSPRVPPEADPPASPLATRGWPALENAIVHLRQDAPDLHRVLVGSLLARPDSTLAAGIILFLTALKAGNLAAWLGENTVRALARGRPDLLSRLNDDFRELARVADDPGSGDWRVAMVPVNAHASIDQLRFMTRREKGDDADSPSPSTRFVVDVTLSRLGRVQIDGLVRSRDKRLDLVVRTAEPLLPEMREDIRRLFTAATQATGIAGLVAFDSRPDGFVEVPAAHFLRGSGAVIA